ncbi:Hpt domain-containing protein [Shimia marina]|uniref:Hpt domain protein n=1 Tax=Shimia marina TaxID=321267 RepID=A0A0P1ERP1_9RHOB|nr:Hpt domain-containing protein [Shimia marina]CUH53170.1 Hpt domain protein [Shimia marina]SFD83125.1 Hpt domain-containing protein [Shimia marina]
MTTHDFQSSLIALKRRFLAGLPERAAEIASLTGALSKSGPCPLQLRQLHLASHKLAGISATYGLAQLGEVARHTETCLEACLTQAPTDQYLRKVLQTADLLRQELNRVIYTDSFAQMP